MAWTVTVTSILLFPSFLQMLSTGIPELQCVEDIHYLRKVFILDKTDDEAAIAFQELINESLNTKATQVLLSLISAFQYAV